MVILRAMVARVAARVICRARGNARLDLSHLDGQTICATRSCGKRLLIELRAALAAHDRWQRARQREGPASCIAIRACTNTRAPMRGTPWT